MGYLRLKLPCPVYLRSKDPARLDPSFSLQIDRLMISATLEGGIPLRTETGNEPHFRSVDHCVLLIEDQLETLKGRAEARQYDAVAKVLLPIVNRFARGIRNFGWVTTIEEYSSDEDAAALLRDWNAEFSENGLDWNNVVRPATGFRAVNFFGNTSPPLVRKSSSLSIDRIPDIEEAIRENAHPKPEQEFVTNALEHLQTGNLRIALLEATVSIELVVDQFIRAYLGVKRGFSANNIQRFITSKLDLAERVGLILPLILDEHEVRAAKIGEVLRGITLRNKVVHAEGRIPASTPRADVQASIYAMLDLALILGDRRDTLQTEPIFRQISKEVSEQFSLPAPTLRRGRGHVVIVRFYFPAPNTYPSLPAVLPPGYAPQSSTTPTKETMEAAITMLALSLQPRDPHFIGNKQDTAE